MRAFGIVMALFGCAIAFFGLVQISEVEDVNRVTCSPSGTTASPQTTCYYDGDPNQGIKQAAGGLAIAVVGAGFVAGGLACAGAGGRSGPPRPSFAPPVGGQAYSGAAGSPPPAYGQQTQQPPPTSSSGPQPWGTPPQQ